MSKVRVVLFNGPPGAGKDVFAHSLSDRLNKDFDHTIHGKFAEPLRAQVSRVFKVEDADIDGVKDLPLHDGLRIRDYMIGQATLDKKYAGQGIYGSILAHSLSDRFEEQLHPNDNTFFLISDSGFDEELQALHFELSKKFEVTIILVHMIRAGHTYASDSRNYIQNPYGPTIEFVNDGDIQGRTEGLLAAIRSVLS